MQPAFGTSQKSKTLLFNSRDIKYKKPFGAVSTAQRVNICFPVKKSFNAEKVTMILRRNEHSEIFELSKLYDDGNYDYFYVDFLVEREGSYYYRFEISRGANTSFVGRGYNGQAIMGDWLPEWQLSVYAKSYVTPDFFKGGVVYHIFADRFCHSGETVLPKYGVTKQWGEDVTIIDPDGIYRANDFYGGNFQGIISKLDYLYELGVTAIYLSPIFLSNSNHRYDTADYLQIDPILGTEEDFAELINKAKEKDIAIILDGVFNHTGADSVYFNKFNHFDSVGAYQSKESPYYDWYTFISYPDTYKCWWGITVVPTIARDAKGFHDLIVGDNGVINKWTKMGVKGWRLDVVDELSSEFLKSIFCSIKSNDKDCLVIGEVWEDATTKHSYGEEREYFRGKELDGVMNYVFKDSIIEYLNGFDGELFADQTMTIIENYPKVSLDVCMSLIDSHDTVRAINALSGKNGHNMTKEEKRAYRLNKHEYEMGKKKLKLASCLQYFLPGVPSLYYGDEIGMQGFEDPINRRPFSHDKIDNELLSHYIHLGQLRRKYKKQFVESAIVKGSGNEVTINRGGIILTVNAKMHTYNINFDNFFEE